MITTTKPKLKHEIKWKVQDSFDGGINWGDCYYTGYTDGKPSTAKKLIKRLRNFQNHPHITTKVQWRVVKYKMTILDI